MRVQRALIVGATLSGVGVGVGAVAQEQQSGDLAVPFFPAASDSRPQGLLRIVNHSQDAGTIAIVAVDDDGNGSDEVTLELSDGETFHLDADALQNGDSEGRLTGIAGIPTGDWRLHLTSDLDIEHQAYARTPDGALWEMGETVPGTDGTYRIATFNPGANVNQVSRLRLVNAGDETASVSVRGSDDAGRSPGPGVTLEVSPGDAKTYTAAELESGTAVGLEGSLGDGKGKWRLVIDSTTPLQVMSLMSSPTGHLTNLSPVPAQESDGIHRVPLFPSAADAYGNQGFVRVVNHSDAGGVVRIRAFDGTSRTYDPVSLSVDARETRHFNSGDLELGNSKKGLGTGTGGGEGDWRLELTSDLEIEVLSYVRSAGGRGYVAPMNETTAREAGGLMRHYVPVFHPADHEGQTSRLHLVNLDSRDLDVAISGLDDAGKPPPEGDVGLVVEAGQTRVLEASDLEDGAHGLHGRFGKGTGKWRLFVAADGKLQVVSLGYSSEGLLSNLSRGIPPAHHEPIVRPDLVVGAPSVSDKRPHAGASFALSATVTNQGEGGADATTLRYYRSTNTAISATDMEVGTHRIDALSAFGSSGASVTLTAPTDPGTYYYGACVDAVTAEADVSNNCSAGVEVTVVLPRPDLTVGPPSVDDATPNPGASFELSVTVANIGDSGTGATTLRYYRSTDAAIAQADTLVGTRVVAGLSAGDSIGTSITLAAPGVAGNYYYGACIDVVAEESRTANNCSSAVAVTVPDPRSVFPDLVVGTPVVSDNRPVPGATIELSATVRNSGGGAAAKTVLHYFRSADGEISRSDTLVDSVAVEGLAASENSRQTVSVTVPDTEGVYYYGACVDAVTDETDTTNNCSVGTEAGVEVPPAPDLGVGSPTVSNAAPETGAGFTLTATVTNSGDAAAEATTLRYYRSTDTSITASDTLEGTAPVEELASTGARTASVALTAPSTVGTYYYGACVDAVANESDTSNNCSGSVTVAVQQARYPDLVVQSPSVSDTNPETGADIELSATVANQGSGRAAATKLRFYRSTDATITASDTEEGSGEVEALPAEGTSSASITLSAPSTAGTYYYGACVDAVARESDTTQNCSSSVEVDVRPVEANVQPSVAAIADPATMTVGDTLEFTVSVSDRNASDTHTVDARSADESVATVSVNSLTLTLVAAGSGTTSISVTATDSSGDDNATSDTVTFTATVQSESGWIRGLFADDGNFKNFCAVPREGLDADENPFPDRLGSTLDENNWLRSWSNDTYLWYDEIEDRDPDCCDTPTYFQHMKTDATTDSGRDKDPFHFTEDTASYLARTQTGASAGYGATFAVLAARPPRDVRIAYTEPDSPATGTGVELLRGTRILRVDDASVIDGSADVINAGLFPSAAGQTHRFEVQDPGTADTRTVSMTSAVVTADPVQHVQVIDTDAGAVGYLLFNSHIATAERRLVDALGRLADANVTDLVLDLRYNLGGYLIIANQLAYMIAGPAAAQGRVFSELKFNDKHTSVNPVTGRTLRPSLFQTTTVGLSSSAGQTLPSLNLDRVFILSGSRTCSASESIINGLRGIDVEVILIGATTCGKPYAFYPTDNCGTTYFTVQIQSLNAKGFGDYADGFAPSGSTHSSGTVLPGCAVADDFDHQFGDPQEARLSAALRFRAAETCTPAVESDQLVSAERLDMPPVDPAVRGLMIPGYGDELTP